MIKKLFKLSLALLVSGTSMAQCSDLFFSEYVEGTSFNKAIEIYNPTSSAINLTDYILSRNNNGAATPTASLTLTGTLAAGDVYVIVLATADPGLLAYADLTDNIVNYNGNDAVYLKKVSTGDTLDIIGVIGVNPGTNWTVGSGATSEYTLVRMAGIQQGSTNWTTGANEWNVFPQNTYTNLGSHTMTPCGACTPTTFNLTLSECSSYTSPSGTYTWTTSGVYNDTIFDAGGCDSMYVIDLTIVPEIISNITASACDSYASPSGTYIWNTTGTYNDTIYSTSGGCDSLFVVDLTITAPSTSSFTVVGCNSYLSPSGILWTATGIYNDTILNAAGCDSIMTFDVTLDPNSPTACAGQCSEIFFSEYIEGSGNNKALEIYNPTFSSVDLSNYVVKRHTNGSPTASGTYALNGILAPGDVYVMGNSQANAAVLAVSDTLSAATFYNGNDAVSLENIITGDTLDIIGQIGIDPGTNWAVPGGATSEYTLVRSIGVQQGNTDWSTAASEWVALPQNTFDSLGAHYMIACTTMPCINTSATISPSTCDTYTSPSGNNTWSVSGTYTDVIPNAAGCDSTITINLTVVAININVTNNDPILTSATSGATYQWLDCNNGNSAVAGATSQTFSPAVNGSYAVKITLNGCTDTSACNTVNAVSLNEFELNQYIVVSPNPTSGDINVNLGRTYENVAIRVLDGLGREVSAHSYDSVSSTDMNINGNAGYYFVEVSINGVRSAIIKLIKN